MKKFAVVFIAAFMVVSCFSDEPQNSSEYSLFADFEYANDYQMGDLFGTDSLYYDETYGLGLGWNDLAFCHRVDAQTMGFKAGFILSHLKGKVYSEDYELDMKDLYRVHAPADSSRTYMVFVDSKIEEDMPAHDIEFVLDDYGTCTVIGCYVNVPLYVAASAYKDFQDGDALVLKATGYREGKVTAEKSIDLITCENGKLTVPQMWTLFDLSPLGDIQYVEFDVTSTKESVPEVFCMDNFGAKVSVVY